MSTARGRVRTAPSHKRVRVFFGGELLADRHRPKFLYETGLPRRTYINKLDVRMHLLTPTASATRCPYKGTARYWTFGEHVDLAWSYPSPFRESQPIAGLVAFYDDRVDLTVDGGGTG